MNLSTSYSSQTVSLETLRLLFSSSARVQVLRIFMLDPTRAYYQRQLEGAAGLPIRAIQRELERLSAAGLLYRRAEGNRSYYQIDMDHPLSFRKRVSRRYLRKILSNRSRSSRL